jgi:ribonuclease T2
LAFEVDCRLSRADLTSILFAFGLLFEGMPTFGFEKITGTFRATQACSAVVRMRDPEAEGVTLRAGEPYTLLGENRKDGPYLQIRLDNRLLWVRRDCGEIDPTAKSSETQSNLGQQQRSAYILALSWFPGFCKSHPQVFECGLNSGMIERPAALVLHGLWPNASSSEYCETTNLEHQLDRSHQWLKLTQLDLTKETRMRLQKVMPGVLSGLDRHEWVKHGRCIGVGQETYFSEALRLFEAIQVSSFFQFLLSQEGHALSLDSLRHRYEASFGAGTGLNLSIQCEGAGENTDVVEIRIRLRGEFGQLGLQEVTREGVEQSLMGCQGGDLEKAQ